jgi:hypothetical protein
MLPLKDMNPTHRFPWLTYALIIINVLVFLWEVSTRSTRRGFNEPGGCAGHSLG